MNYILLAISNNVKADCQTKSLSDSAILSYRDRTDYIGICSYQTLNVILENDMSAKQAVQKKHSHKCGSYIKRGFMA